MSDKVELFAQVAPEAVTARLQEWRAQSPRAGVLVLLPEAERGKIPELQALFARASVPVVGAVFPQLVNDTGFQAQGVVLVKLDPMPPYVLKGGLDAADATLEGAVEDLSQGILRGLGEESGNTLFMLFDAMVPRIASILETLYLKLADRVAYVGFNAGSETFTPIPCLFDGQRTVQGGVLALLLPGERRAVLEHGYRPPEQMVAATSTEGNRIISIDWRPAFEVYREQVKKHYGEEINKENFYRLAVHFPFGIVRADGEVLVRIPVALQDDGSLFCVGEVPANSILTLLAAPSPDSIDTAQSLTRQLGVGGPDLLVFYCAGRRLHMGPAAEQELRELRARSGVAHVAGALSLGEIGSARRSGYPLFHNGAVVCMLA